MPDSTTLIPPALVARGLQIYLSMIDHLGTADAQTRAIAQTGQKKVLKMVKASRMGGSMPVWEKVSNAKQEVEKNLSVSAVSNSESSYKTGFNPAIRDVPSVEQTEEFTFGDLLDMVNPLHHIPVVGHVYRSLSGDEIKPIGRIIGGAAFGGPMGAAAGLVNVVVEGETGRDVAGNAIALVLNGEAPTYKSKPSAPEVMLADASDASAYDDLPAALLAFTDMTRDSGIVIETVKMAGGRTAGYTSRPLSAAGMSAIPEPRLPITEVIMRPFPNNDDEG